MTVCTRRISRRRIQQLFGAGWPEPRKGLRVFQHMGPTAPLAKFLDENVPAVDAITAMNNLLDDRSEWVCDFIEVEPDWHIEQHDVSGWIVWEDRGHPFDRASAPIWKTQELARRHIELLTDNFWAEP